MKILVVKPTALGDVAQAVRVAPLLKQGTGCRELVWLVDEEYAPVLELCPSIDRLILFPRRKWRKNWLRAETAAWFRQLRRERFDIVLDLQGLARSALMTLATGAPRRIGLRSSRELASLAYTEMADDHSIHAVDRYREAARILAGTEPQPEQPALRVPRGDLPCGLSAGKFTVIHPYSQWTTKLWGWQNYETLIQSLPQETFVLVGQGTFFPVLAPNVVDLRNKTSLAVLLGLLGEARAVISTDSGPLHLADAFETPVVAVYGASDPRKTGPKGKASRILTGNVPCRPCLSRKCEYHERMACMREVELGHVVEAWRELSR